jgi:hypothetical protein
VGDFNSSPIHSHTCIEVTHGTLWTLARYNLFEDLTVQMQAYAVDALAVPSDEHTPLSEIVV